MRIERVMVAFVLASAVSICAVTNVPDGLKTSADEVVAS